MMHLPKCLWSIAALSAVLLTASCQRQEGAYAYTDVNAQGWHYDSAAVIVVDTLRTTAVYHPEVHVRLTQHYPYTTLQLIVEQQWTAVADTTQADTTAPSLLATATKHCDTLTFTVAPNGSDLVNTGLSRLHLHARLAPLSLHAGQTGQIRLRPAMRVHRLRGVSDVGLSLLPEGASTEFQPKLRLPL